MRPISVEGAAVPPLPERADDARVAHVNDVFRSVAAANAGDDDVRRRARTGAATRRMATDTGMRWDGVHVYKPGRQADLRHHRPGAAGDL